MKNTEQQINLRGSSCGSSVLPPFRISICSRGRDAVAAVCWISSQVKATVPLLQQSATHLKILQYLYIISCFQPVGEFFFFFLGGLLLVSRGVVGVLVLAAGAFWGVAGVLVLGAGGAFFA